MKYIRAFLVFSAALSLSFSFSSPAQATPVAKVNDQLIVGPADGHKPFIDSIDHAKSSVDMVMFHLTDPDVIASLKKASSRGVAIRIILDREITSRSTPSTSVMNDLKTAGLQVQLSSPGFTITHEKSMVVDGSSLFITTMNMTRMADKTRDFGIITDDASAITEYKLFFDTDWKNAQTGGAVTPSNSTRLVWSPNTSQQTLVHFIGSAKKSVAVEVENLGSIEMQNALTDAAKAGVEVKILVPACVFGDSPRRNETYLDELTTAGVNVRVMRGPLSASKPYIHAKAIVVDGEKFFVGSENFSFNSLTKAREVGIIVEDVSLAAKVAGVLKSDFAIGGTRSAGAAEKCD